MQNYPERAAPSAGHRNSLLPNKVVAFIDGLYEEIERLKRQQNTRPAPDSHPSDASPLDEHVPQAIAPESTRSATTFQARVENIDSEIDPTINDAPWFDNRNVFHTPILISEAADTAFATRFRQVISDPRAPEPTHLLRVNYASDDALMALVQSGVPWPSQSRARFLLEAALKHIGRCYYIVRVDEVREGLSRIFTDPTWGGPVVCCRFWALFALGQLYTSRAAAMQSYPGMAYFAQASRMLGYLNERPGTETIETLLLLSMYSLALNRRYSAYILSGTAMRSAIVMGLHFNISDIQLSDLAIREHRKRLFWTTYMFDRMWGASLGHPPAIHDEEIEVDLPSVLAFNGTGGDQLTGDGFDSQYHVAHIELTRRLANVVRSIYTLRRKQQDAQLSRQIHQSLQDLQAWVDRLPPHLQIDHTPGVACDWKVVSLHLSFYQCVIIATRPILLHALRIQVAAQEKGPTASSFQVPTTALALSEACVRCARHSAQLLTQSWIDGSFFTFDCFFTQYLFSSLVVLAIASILDGQDNQINCDTFEEASRLLRELKEAGNCVAQEYCHHIEAIEAALFAHTKPMAADPLGFPEGPTVNPAATSQLSNMPHEAISTAAWTDSSLQQLLSQPELDMQFLEDAVRDTYSQGLYQHELDSGS
ncbi:hypothetical protein N7517_011626 [Penicillium concentricum]|uniref:Xylanolytic transcriptional activator regulatory domain-containing protein n=1 Tax=Penicillium concentricum TaxID=293559 RepID=A0A9W9RB77_9EURO|nr:uncharacterized protein N7517_011626 [Penicillium concentricum]KAJ5357017.1 hypothetical protein N7517_011626 [Penicillium concentricum]